MKIWDKEVVLDNSTDDVDNLEDLSQADEMRLAEFDSTLRPVFHLAVEAAVKTANDVAPSELKNIYSEFLIGNWSVGFRDTEPLFIKYYEGDYSTAYRLIDA